MLKHGPFVVLFLTLFLASSCANVHHIQLGEVDSRKDISYIPFEIHLSDVGVDTEMAAQTLQYAGRQGEALGQVMKIVALFQQGPHTGRHTYNEKYADTAFYQIYEKCPSGDITGLTAIRENRTYDAVANEYVTIRGFCKSKKELSSL